MVDALREVRRILKPCGILINVQPVTAPIVVEVILAARPVWAKEVASYSAPEDVAAAKATVQHAVSHDWFALEKSLPYDLESHCDTAADFEPLRADSKTSRAAIRYDQLEERRSRLGADRETARLRCRRPWTLSTYRKT